jgi:chemotaxis methyl-accepting protein methylase
MRARAALTYQQYAALLDSDPAEYEQLLQALTINVTKFFRNPEVYSSIARDVVPDLWKLPDSRVTVWSAGCSSGEEPYSLAILLLKHASGLQGAEAARLRRFRVVGTDIDRPSLASAERAAYGESAFADTPEDVRRNYFTSQIPAAPVDAVRQLVEFRYLDLFNTDALPAPVHAIVCRNVIIYFDRASQERLFSSFHRVLAPGGFLVLGKVETILGESRALFAPVNAVERVFRKQ